MIQTWPFGTTRAQPATATPDQLAAFDLVACRHWCSEEYEAIETRIRALQEVTLGATNPAVSAYYEECVAGLADVRNAMRDVNLVLLEKGLEPWVATQSPLMAYLSSAFVWCGDVIADLQELAEHHGNTSSWDAQRRDVAESAKSYIVEFLEPLYRGLNQLCGSSWPGHPLQRVRPPVERLESQIVSLSWELNELPPLS